ncbi:WD repeat domain phosphoinositide-interacting protein 2, partial [Caligus rogercresseyi]
MDLIYGKGSEDQVIVLEPLVSSPAHENSACVTSKRAPRSLNRARLVVCLEESLYIHNIRDMKILHTIKDTPSNPKGLCALSINSDHCYLPIRAALLRGKCSSLMLNLQAKLMIPAHDAPLAALAFNAAGNRLATARSGEHSSAYSLYPTVRNLPTPIRRPFIYLSFEEEDPIFPLRFRFVNSPSDAGWMGYLSKAVSASASYLPAQVTDTFNQSRAFATVTLPATSSGGHNTVAIANVSR